MLENDDLNTGEELLIGAFLSWHNDTNRLRATKKIAHVLIWLSCFWISCSPFRFPRVVTFATCIHLLLGIHLVADLSRDVVLEMAFFELADPDIRFATREFAWSSYATADALATTKRVAIVDTRDFCCNALDPELSSYVVNAAPLDTSMHPGR